VADEAWRPWPREPQYLVSDQGRVRGPSGKILKYSLFTNGRLQVSPYLSNEKRRKTREVHTMVLEGFGGLARPAWGPCTETASRSIID
jgi:hypothetical protein